jgi:hypothetical protein
MPRLRLSSQLWKSWDCSVAYSQPYQLAVMFVRSFPFYFFPPFGLRPPNAAAATLLTVGDVRLLLSNLLALRATLSDVLGFPFAILPTSLLLFNYAAFFAAISASVTSSVKSKTSWNGSSFV